MTERHTKANATYANYRYCPMQESRRCAGPSCMAWIQEVDEDERPTGLGRCGMVSSWIIGPCVTTTAEEPKDV